MTLELVKSVYAGAAAMFTSEPWEDISERQTFRISVEATATSPQGLKIKPGLVWACVLGYGARAAEAAHAKEGGAGEGGAAGAGASDDPSSAKPAPLFVLRGVVLFFTRYEAEQRLLADATAPKGVLQKAIGNVKRFASRAKVLSRLVRWGRRRVTLNHVLHIDILDQL